MTNLKPPHTTWNWQNAHFRDPGGMVPDSLMRNPTVTRPEALALTVYMLSQWKRDVPESYLAPDKIEQKYRALHPVPLTGEQVYRQYCTACHGNGTYTRWDKKFNRFIPAIRGVSLISTATREYFQSNIEQGRPGTQMPAWGPHAGGLLPEEITGSDRISSLRRCGVGRSGRSRDDGVDAARGRQQRSFSVPEKLRRLPRHEWPRWNGPRDRQSGIPTSCHRRIHHSHHPQRPHRNRDAGVPA